MDETEVRATGSRLPMEIYGGLMLLGLEIRGTSINLAIDSGASNLVLYASGCRKLEKQVRISHQSRPVTGAARSGSIEVAFLDELKVGEEQLGRSMVGLLRRIERPVDGLLPLNLFRSVYFNNSDGYVILNPRLLN